MANVCVDSSYFRVTEDGELSLKPGIQGFRERVIFRDPGAHQFTKESYPWLARVFIEVQGAGGGSAGADASADECIARAGGAGGAFASSWHSVNTLGDTETIVVGAGGVAGGTASSGGNGGSSSFGGLVVAAGGDGGTAPMVSGTTPDATSGVPGASGPASVGGLVSGGGAGHGAIRLTGRQALAGAGGESRLGHGGYGRATEGDGGVPRGRGSGAGGALSYGNPVQGTPGADGIVIVYLFG